MPIFYVYDGKRCRVKHAMRLNKTLKDWKLFRIIYLGAIDVLQVSFIIAVTLERFCGIKQTFCKKCSRHFKNDSHIFEKKRHLCFFLHACVSPLMYTERPVYLFSNYLFSTLVCKSFVLQESFIYSNSRQRKDFPLTF